MSRLEKVQEHVNQVFAGFSSDKQNEYIREDYIHIYGVSFFCTFLALKRKLNPELASVIGMLHDVYRLKTGINNYHNVSGAEMSRIILRDMNIFTDDEKQIILSAIYHHSDKAHIHNEYDELLKDADLFQSFMKTGACKLHISHLPRLKNLAEELSIAIDFDSITVYRDEPSVAKSIDKRNLLAQFAEELASGPIAGSREDPVYMNLIRYWPEDSAFDELKNGWCAAFVYHCCQEAGFVFPIKWRPDTLRFACVAAWNTWARENNYFIESSPNFIPERGDIVLYRNIVPPENKKEEQRNVPIDHIGIVLGSEAGQFTVAEGNVNNQNVSGILTRPLHQNIEGYIRIDNNLKYDGWKYEYKGDASWQAKN